MQGISSKALAFGEPKNKEKTFQGQRFDDELGLNWVQFKWRNHDPQIGRFIEIDPLSDDYEYNSTYAFSENKVISHVELEGLEAVEIIVSTIEAVGVGVGVTAGIAAVAIVAVATHPEILLSGGSSAAQMDFKLERQLLKASSSTTNTTASSAQVASSGGAMGQAGRALAQGINKEKQSNKADGGGRGSNNRKPDPKATGDHSVIDKNGNTTYKQNSKNPTNFDEVKRTDVKGKAHTNTDGAKVETPHVHEKGKKNVRTAVKGQDY
jgi:RHS repeat-associated protein